MRENTPRGTSVLKPSVLYFGAVFAAGFVLGPIRVLWLAPRVGTRTAELLEIPLMVIVTFFVARRIVHYFKLPPMPSTIRLRVGFFGLLLLAAAEVGLGVALRGMSVAETITSRDPVSGTVYVAALILFAFMPMLE